MTFKSHKKKFLIRNASIDDCEAVSVLLIELGLKMPSVRLERNLHWKQMWIDNPAIKSTDEKFVPGKVLEFNKQIVGFFGSVPLLYYLGKKQISMSTAIHWGIKKEARSETNKLANAYFNEINSDVALVTTSNKAASRLFKEHGYIPVPQPDYDTTLYWITNATGFLSAYFRKKSFPRVLSIVLGSIIGKIVNCTLPFLRRFPKVSSSCIDIINISEVDTTFDELWSSKLKEPEKLLACRSSETLRWHFNSKSLSDRCKILTYVNKRLKGYIIILREDSPDIGLKRLRIVDVFIENDDDLILKKLLISSYWLAKKSGCHSLEIIGLPTSLRKKIKVHCPFERKMPSWPLFYKPGSKLMAEKLNNELVWYITAYDGDSSLL